MTPIWVPLQAVFIIHDRQIARHGGAPGLRDRAPIESACARPRNLWEYERHGLLRLAASYAHGIVKAHGFVDGNKRTGFVTALTFLRLNGLTFRSDPTQGVRMMENLAAGTISEGDFADWLTSGATPLTD